MRLIFIKMKGEHTLKYLRVLDYKSIYTLVIISVSFFLLKYEKLLEILKNIINPIKNSG